jgi:transposase-like protein
MPKSHRSYAPEFRRQMVDLVRSGRTPEPLSREFEPTAQAIWNWVRQADRDDDRLIPPSIHRWRSAAVAGRPACAHP